MKKDGNQEVFDSLEGAKFDTGKLRMDLIPPEAIEGLAEVLTMGAEKYAARNWEKGFDWGRSVAALKRHLTAWERREDLDPESGLNHMKHVLCNAVFLVTFIEREVGRDTRTWGRMEVPDQHDEN
ncbi:dATP/dGTP diphosphohydrolase domain-containing protein [Desulfovibrio caledoniensis]